MIDDELDLELDNDDLDDIEPIVAEPQLYEHFRVVVDKGQEMVRVDKYLFDKITNASRNRIQKAADAGYVMANGKAVKCSYKVKPLDVITLMLDRPRYENEIIPQDIPLDIAFEDEDLCVIRKPKGMVVHPAPGNPDGTLVNALLHHCGESLSGIGGEIRPGIVHRIDKDTSGLLIVAKTDAAHRALASQIEAHSFRRENRAVLHGHFRELSGTVGAPIGRSEKDRKKMCVTQKNAREAVTHYEILEDFGAFSYAALRLETGRTHQIRVHMAHIGHPLFGDERYGGKEIRQGTIYSKYKQFIRNCFELCPRQALHARTLGFDHPRTGKPVRFDSALPADMQALLAKWRQYAANMPEE